MRSASLLIFASLLALKAAAVPTSLMLRPEQPEQPWAASYSQAVMLRARLLRTDGQPIAGERVAFRLQRGDENSDFLIEDPVTDAEGFATARLTLVNGRHGGQTFAGRPATPEQPGERYLVKARFRGAPFAEGCDELDAGPAPDGGAEALCDAEDALELYVGLEKSTLVIAPGIELQLGDVVQLVATLTDDNGDAPVAGTASDGTSPVALTGRRVGFFYDVDGSGSPQENERIVCANTGVGHALTNADGRAACEFFADPAFIRTVNVLDGIHAQFGGDEQYSLSGASQAIRVRAGRPDAERTLLAVTPDEARADGFSLLVVEARLVDEENNLLSLDDPSYDVAFTTDLGTLEGAVEQDPLTGHYRQTLKAPRQPGDATVQVLVEDVQGSTAQARFEGGGCSCQSGGDLSLLSLAGLLLGLALAKRRRFS
jgi:hypothetical protein